MDSVIVNDHGQITLPPSIMEKMGLEKGSKLFFCLKEGEYVLKSTPINPVDELRDLCEGFADEMGWKTEDDVVKSCKEFRNKRVVT